MFQMLSDFAHGSALFNWVNSIVWLWPFLEIIHFIGLSLLMGALIVTDLRLAGHFRLMSAAATHKLLPVAFIGFGLNLVSGTLFFFGDPMRYAVNIGFQIKMILILFAGLNAALYYWKIHAQVDRWDLNTEPPLLARYVAYASLITWTTVLLCGRLIPYVGTG